MVLSKEEQEALAQTKLSGLRKKINELDIEIIKKVKS